MFAVFSFFYFALLVIFIILIIPFYLLGFCEHVYGVHIKEVMEINMTKT